MERDKAIQLVFDAILKNLHKPSSDYTEITTFKELGADSLSVIELSLTIESSLDGKEISNADIDKIKTVGDLIVILEQKF